MKVLATTRLTDEQLASLREVSPDLEIVRETDEERAREHYRDAEILLTFLLPGPLEEAPKLKWIQLVSAGVEHLFAAGIARTDILVTTVSGIHGPAMAEYAVAAMVMHSRQMPMILKEMDRRQWRPGRRRVYYGETIQGKTVGILGLGGVGGGIARAARCMGMRVLGLRRSGRREGVEEAAEQVYGPGELPEMLSRCDFVVVALPLTAETRGLIGEREFRAMKPNACLVNVARGEIVDETALARALREGWIGGAVLDVTTVEPLPPESPLWDLPNTILTPHISGNFLAYLDRSTEVFRENLRRYLAGEPMVNVLDKTRGY